MSLFKSLVICLLILASSSSFASSEESTPKMPDIQWQLWNAFSSNDVQRVSTLLREGADVNFLYDGKTLADYMHLKILIGADNSPLLPMMNVLASYGAIETLAPTDLSFDLLRAYLNHNPERFLAACRPDRLNNHFSVFLFQAALERNYFMLRALIETGENHDLRFDPNLTLEIKTADGEISGSFYHVAISHGDVIALRLFSNYAPFLSSGMGINFQGQTLGPEELERICEGTLASLPDVIRPDVEHYLLLREVFILWGQEGLLLEIIGHHILPNIRYYGQSLDSSFVFGSIESIRQRRLQEYERLSGAFQDMYGLWAVLFLNFYLDIFQR